MLKKASTAYLAALAVGLGCMSTTTTVTAGGFGPMNMMNPGKWFGNRDNGPDYDDLPPPPPPGFGAPYGAPPPGPGYGALPPLRGAPMYNPAPGAYGAAPTAPYGTGYGIPAHLSTPAYSSPQSYSSPQGYAPQNTSSSSQASRGPSRAEMDGRIQELEQRLHEMEAKSRAAEPAPQPTAPPPASYQYYSGDQTQSQTYPFRPMNLGK